MPSFSPIFNKGKQQKTPTVVIWTTVGEHLDSTRNTWDYLNKRDLTVHLLWNPATGDIVEGVPPNYQGTMFKVEGFKIAVIGDPLSPFTSAPLEGCELVCEAFNSLGVPSVWPKGPPSLTSPLRGIQGALKPGHYSADQINPDFRGVGPIDTRRLLDGTIAG